MFEFPKVPGTDIEIYQKPKELKKLVDLYETLKAKNVIEVGSMYGGTLYYWIAKAAAGARVMSIDLPVGPGDGRYPKVVEAHMEWLVWAKGFDVELLTRFGPSQDPHIIADAKVTFKDGVDFLFIDAGHAYEQVKADFQNYGPLVKMGGLIALHDIVGGEGVPQLWEEIKGAGFDTEEIVEDYGQGECGIGIVKYERDNRVRSDPV